MHVSSGILLVLGFLFSLGFYDDSGVCSKYSPSRASGRYVDAWPILINPSYELGQASTGPWKWARQAHLYTDLSSQFLPSSVYIQIA